MALTDKLNRVVDCFPKGREQPDLDRLTSANKELVAIIRNNEKFCLSGEIRILDLGSADNGSDLVNFYGEKFPGTKITYLDRSEKLIKKLNKKNKVLANATNMPFPDNYFDIAYAGYLDSFRSGILKDELFSKDESYRIAKETNRILKEKGLFIFTYTLGDDLQTLRNLSEIGFRELEHLQRIGWYGRSSTDIYAVIK